MEDLVEFVSICRIDSEIESHIMGSLLSEAGIPHHLVSYHDTAYDGLFQFQKGWGEVRAPLSFKAEILEIRRDIQNSRPKTF